MPENRIALASQECESVLEVACNASIDLTHSCGGHGTCGTCRVIIESDLTQLPDRNEIELEISLDRGFQANERLACQLPVVDGLVVRIPKPTI